jgi:Uncharacterised nucleotidyltransferase
MWAAAEALALRAAGVRELRVHRLQLIARRALRARGEPVPPELAPEALWNASAALAVPVLLARVRAACDGPLVLMKGPEVGARYPDAALRPCKDLDLLVEHPARAQRALLEAGFVLTGDPALYRGIHHLRPLALPGLPLTIEVHSRPKWPDRLLGPPAAEVIEAAVPSATGVAGLLAPAPAHHAVMLAAHAWAHEPLASAGRLLDVAALAVEADRGELDAVARRWGCRRVWRVSWAAAEALFCGAPAPPALSVWARHLAAARERTVLESHVARLAGQPLSGVGAAVVRSAGRGPGEPWSRKLTRARMALGNAFVARSEHENRMTERSGA